MVHRHFSAVMIWISAAAENGHWQKQQRKILNIDEIEQALLALKDEAPAQDWRKAPLSDIIAFIITRYHDRHRAQLPELILQAEKWSGCMPPKPVFRKGWPGS